MPEPPASASGRPAGAAAAAAAPAAGPSRPPPPPGATPHPHHRHKVHWGATLTDNLRLFAVQLACTGGAGAAARTAVAPLERVKLLMQTEGARAGAGPAAPAPLTLRRALAAMRDAGGRRAAFQGNGANCLRLLPDTVFRFLFYDQFKVVFAPPENSPLGVPEKVAAGAAAGMARTALFYPLDVARVRIAVDWPLPPPADAAAAGGAAALAAGPRRVGRAYGGGLAAMLAATAREEGLAGLYRGAGASVVGLVPYLALSFAAFDELRHRLPDDKWSVAQPWYPLAKMGCGGLAAVAAATATYPLDTIRRRMQVNGARGGFSAEPAAGAGADGGGGPRAPRYSGYVDCLSQTLRAEGLRGLFRGWHVACLKIVPGAAVQFAAYDLLRTGMQLIDPAAGVHSQL